MDCEKEIAERVKFIAEAMVAAGAKGLVFGNSGGKDCALVGALCKRAADKTIGVIMPCTSNRNYNEDKNDAMAVNERFGIETRIVDLTETKQTLVASLEKSTTPNQQALSNIAPRLRMTTLYAIAASEGALVVGTGNKCEGYMGYFTKWGDGAYDINPISDLTVSQIYELLAYLGAPEVVIKKAPSAGLFDGQTDEQEMGVTYAAIERYINGEQVSDAEKSVIERYHRISEHKRRNPLVYTKN